MAVAINLTTKNHNKKATKTITSVNPSASDADIKEFANALNELSDNELVHVEKVEKTDIDLD